METERLIADYLELKGVELDDIDVSDFGQFLEDQHLAVYDKISREYLD